MMTDILTSFSSKHKRHGQHLMSWSPTDIDNTDRSIVSLTTTSIFYDSEA